MKNISLLYLLVGFLMIGMAACNDDDLLDDDTKDVREVFVGSWQCTQTSNVTGISVFTVNIDTSTSFPNRILMDNFYELGATKTTFATVSTIASSTVTIPTQNIDSNTIVGDGVLNNDNKITMEYVVDDGNAPDSLTSVFTRL